MKRISKNDTINSICNEFLKLGWYIKSQNKHAKLRNDDLNVTLTVPITPSDKRSVLNWKAQLRRALEGKSVLTELDIIRAY